LDCIYIDYSVYSSLGDVKAQLEEEGSRDVTFDRWVIYLRFLISCRYDFV